MTILYTICLSVMRLLRIDISCICNAKRIRTEMAVVDSIAPRSIESYRSGPSNSKFKDNVTHRRYACYASLACMSE